MESDLRESCGICGHYTIFYCEKCNQHFCNFPKYCIKKHTCDKTEATNETKENYRKEFTING